MHQIGGTGLIKLHALGLCWWAMSPPPALALYLDKSVLRLHFIADLD